MVRREGRNGKWESKQSERSDWRKNESVGPSEKNKNAEHNFLRSPEGTCEFQKREALTVR